jgi:hypothetical protein
VPPFLARPVFPAHDGKFWNQDDWRNWRRRVRQGEPERQRRDRKNPTPRTHGCAPNGTRPRDLRSSYVTLRIYEGVPLTQIAKEVGTSVRMIELHYAGVIANWDGKQHSAEASIKAARKASIRAPSQLVDAEWTRWANQRDLPPDANSLETSGKPSVGLEPTTPSLPWKCSTS